jgi:hypothetical protein
MGRQKTALQPCEPGGPASKVLKCAGERAKEVRVFDDFDNVGSGFHSFTSNSREVEETMLMGTNFRKRGV